MTIRMSQMVEDPDRLRRRLASLEARLEAHRLRYPTQADEVLRLSEVASGLRDGGTSSRNTVAVSREEQAEIDRLAKLSDEMRGSTQASAPATGKDTDPADADEIARLAAIAKERR